MSLGKIASRLPGGSAALSRALANSNVVNLARSLDINLADEERLEAALVRTIVAQEQLGPTAVKSKVAGISNGASLVSFCSAGTMLGFGFVRAQDYIKAVLETYRDIGLM